MAKEAKLLAIASRSFLIFFHSRDGGGCARSDEAVRVPTRLGKTFSETTTSPGTVALVDCTGMEALEGEQFPAKQAGYLKAFVVLLGGGLENRSRSLRAPETWRSSAVAGDCERLVSRREGGEWKGISGGKESKANKRRH